MAVVGSRLLQLLAGFVENFTERHRNQLQMRGQVLEFRRGQSAKKMVLIRAVEWWHR